MTDDYIIEAVTQQIDDGNVEDLWNEPDIIAGPLSTNLSEQEKIVALAKAIAIIEQEHDLSDKPAFKLQFEF